MQRSKIKKIEIYSAIMVMILGTFLHFIWELSGQNAVVALFSPINESVWEHLKLLFFPVFFVTGFCSLFFAGKNLPFFYSHAKAVLCGMAFLVTGFYTYSGILGTSILFADVALFYITVIVIYRIAYRQLTESRAAVPYAFPGILFFLFLTIIFIVFTLYPPAIGLFLPPG